MRAWRTVADRPALRRSAWSGVAATVVFVATWIVLVLVPATAQAGNPDQRWRTIETEHFYIHYFAGEEEAADRVALIAEKAYDELTLGWGHRVFLKTHVTLVDTQDTANGRASAVPFPNVVAYATAPEALSVLEAYDDWLDILITHELVHVVHLDTVHGISRLANALLGFGVLGKVTAPNILQPRWIVEGVATMEESLKSSQGRRHSAQFDAFIRMAVVDGQFQTLDQISSGARIWPHGSSVYLYGVHFMHYIGSHYGLDKLRELSHIYATQLVPFGINRAIKKVLGVDFQQLYAEFKTDTVRRFQAQVRRIRKRGLRQGVRLTYSGEATRYPMWSADDAWVYFYKADGHREEGLKRILAKGGRIREGKRIGREGVDVDVEHVIDIEDVSEATFVGATGDVVFDMTGVYDNRYRWNDLYRYNGGDPKDAEQLTFGLRATEPHASPDGRTVVFRRNDMAQSRLAFLDLASGDVEEVAPMSKIGQVYTPRFSPDGEQVAFSAWREGGYRDIYVYTRATGEIERLTADRHMDLSPSWSPDGRYIVFSSDRDGVFNLYVYDTTSKLVEQVSNVLGAAYEPMVSHDGTRIAYIGYSAYGYDLWVMPFDPETWMPAPSPVSALPVAEDPQTPLPGSGGRPPSLSSKRYMPIKTMYPRGINISTFSVLASSGGNALQLTTALSDVVGLHTVSGAFNYLFDERIATGGVSYALRRFYPNFTFSFSRGYRRSGQYTRYLYERGEGSAATYQQRGYRERTTAVDVRMGVPILRHARHNAEASVSYAWTRAKNLDAGDLPIDPNAPISSLPEVGDFASVALGLSYSNESDGLNRFSFGAERGRAARVSLTIFDEKLGGDYGDLQATATYRENIPMPWRGHQTLTLSADGGVSARGLRRRGGFCVGDYQYGADIVRGFVERGNSLTGCAGLLRGYGGPNNPSNQNAIAGSYFAVLSASYRIPIVDVDRGIGTAPFLFQRAALLPFVDWGRAWDNPIQLKQFLWGAGASLLFSFRVGYVEPITLVLQYAHGFDEELGSDSFRALLGARF